jgi:hypothetical protein
MLPLPERADVMRYNVRREPRARLLRASVSAALLGGKAQRS